MHHFCPQGHFPKIFPGKVSRKGFKVGKRGSGARAGLKPQAPYPGLGFRVGMDGEEAWAASSCLGRGNRAQNT